MSTDSNINAIVSQVMKQVGSQKTPQWPRVPIAGGDGSQVTEFVGTSKFGDAIGLVIANVDSQLAPKVNAGEYRALGIVSGRTGAGPFVYAADEGVKAANVKLVDMEFPRDTKGGPGRGSFVVFGAHDVSDVRTAVEVTLDELNRTFGDVYTNEMGYVEFQFTPRASDVIAKMLGATVGEAVGLTACTPAGVGLVVADTVLKSADVQLVGYSSPDEGSALSNEVAAVVQGDADAVRQAIKAGRDIGRTLLATMGGPTAPVSMPYI